MEGTAIKNLTIWDWHYQIFFDSCVLKQVDAFIGGLRACEQQVYMYIRDFFLGFYSISQLIDAIEARPAHHRSFVEIAAANQDKLILTPSALDDAMKKRIFALPEACQKDVLHLLDVSHASHCLPDFQQYCQVVFGPLFPAIAAVAVSEGKWAKIDHGRKLQPTDILSFAEQKMKNITSDSEIIHRYGHFSPDAYDTEMRSDTGYAEWWDHELLNSDRDKLVLFTNPDSMFINDLQYTLIHEIFPGHGHFYRCLAHNSGHMFDHGAMALIEGWATYAEWNTVPSAYIQQIRQNGCAYLAASLSCTGDVLAQNLLKMKRALGFSDKENFRTITYATQYIGFLESYYMGALWFEQYFAREQLYPVDFFKMVQRGNVGEFFSLW